MKGAGRRFSGGWLFTKEPVDRRLKVTTKSELDIEGGAACRAINPAFTRFTFHSQLAFASRACDFDFRYVGGEGEMVGARCTFEVSRTLIHTNNQHCTALRATHFLLLPLLSGDGVIDTNLSGTECALQITKGAWKQALAFRATECRRRDPRFNR